MARAAALTHCRAEPPITSHRAAAAMAAAVPHSAWQPPAAPEMLARAAVTAPTPPAVRRASRASRSWKPYSS